ncbi:hypothetical protein BCV70DRAFT_196970 [Testicularia cyperi]|uniref:Macrofage activating glyco protein n=1 Tax=Testicularia cyperi TaxID=1882483 RepID=A0A317XX92_9BASI|nr:hypothetical protein BCV70DRAFT_196970 [Testicularia cyperi]
MTRFTLSTAVALFSVASVAMAQGDPEATADLNLNRPTKSWTQWQPKATYAFNELPDQYMGANRIPTGEGGTPGGEPQFGYNTCARNAWNQDSRCQTAWINSLEDFCLWAPSEYGTVGDKERSGVAYCTTDRHGTRLIPDGTITGAHFVQTRDYVQVTGVGDFTSMNIPLGDEGGEFDGHGADDLSNPIGGIVYTTANPASNGEPYFIREWTNFMSWDRFCFRACWGQNAAAQCEHIYDVLGCFWNIPANYSAGVFESCDGDIGMLQGIYDGSTFRQGDPVTPSAHPAPASSQCSTTDTIRHGLLAASFASASTSSSAAAATSTGSETAASASAASPTGGVAAASSSGTQAARPSSTSAGSSSGSTSGAMSNVNSASLVSLAAAAMVGIFALGL